MPDQFDNNHVIFKLQNALAEFYNAVSDALMAAHGPVTAVSANPDGSIRVSKGNDVSRRTSENARRVFKEQASIIELLTTQLPDLLREGPLHRAALHHLLGVEVRRLERFAMKFIPGPFGEKIPGDRPAVLLKIMREMEPLRGMMDTIDSLAKSIIWASPLQGADRFVVGDLTTTHPTSPHEIPFPADHYHTKYGITPNTLRKARKAGRIDGVKRRGRWFYAQSEVRKEWPDVFEEPPDVAPKQAQSGPKQPRA